MKFTKALIKGKFVKRYKRFFADVKVNKRIITAHCPNTGPMKGILSDGAKVRVSYSSSPKRKLSWTWEQIQVVNNTNDFVNGVTIDQLSKKFSCTKLTIVRNLKKNLSESKYNSIFKKK